MRETRVKSWNNYLLGAFVAVATILCPSARAADGVEVSWPKIIRIVVPFSPGAANDTFARALGKELTQSLGSTIVVENRPGAGGSIGAELVARAAPDGATILLTSVTYATNAALQKNVSFDPTGSLAPVAMVAHGPMLIAVNGNSPYKTLTELLAASRGSATTVTYGSAGIGSIAHMSSELLNAMAKTDARHIPYKGVSNAVADLLGGRIDFLVTTIASVRGQIQTGTLRALAVTSLEKSPLAPNIPPVAQDIPGYSVEAWWGIFAPAGMSAVQMDALNGAIRKANGSPELQRLYAAEGAEGGTLTRAAFADYVRADIKKWRDLASGRHIDLDR
jgi:tripartite-type tricarboxylate transporter receptor subunit TctC